MEFHEYILALIVIGCVTKIMLEGMRTGFFVQRRQIGNGDELRQLRESVQKLEAATRQLATRMENLETVVTGKEYQAAQRVARALESTQGQTLTPPARASQVAVLTKSGE